MMESGTLRQIAVAELWAATDAYCAARDGLPKTSTAFVAESVRLHVARGADIPRAYVRESRRITRESE